MTHTPTHPLVVESKAEWGRYGPAMNALKHVEQAFLEAYLLAGGRNLKRLAAEAGLSYRDAWYLVRDQRFIDAMREEAQKRMGGAAYLATEVVIEILDDPVAANKDKLAAAKMIFDRVGMHAKTEHTVKVEHVSAEEQIAKVRNLAAQLGLDAEEMLVAAGVIVEAEYTVENAHANASSVPDEIPEGFEGLEDLLL